MSPSFGYERYSPGILAVCWTLKLRAERLPWLWRWRTSEGKLRSELHHPPQLWRKARHCTLWCSPSPSSWAHGAVKARADSLLSSPSSTARRLSCGTAARFVQPARLILGRNSSPATIVSPISVLIESLGILCCLT